MPWSVKNIQNFGLAAKFLGAVLVNGYTMIYSAETLFKGSGQTLNQMGTIATALGTAIETGVEGWKLFYDKETEEIKLDACNDWMQRVAVAHAKAEGVLAMLEAAKKS